jgi:hypothetical protein
MPYCFCAHQRCWATDLLACGVVLGTVARALELVLSLEESTGVVHSSGQLLPIS